MTIISHFFWPFLRISAFFFTAPFFSDKIISGKNKVILSALISFLIFPFLPEIHVIFFSVFGFLLLIHQILIGVILGFTFQLLFAIINLSGEMISLQMGLSFSTFFDFYSHVGTTVVSRLFNVFILFLFLSLNIHLNLISILVYSFYKVPIDIKILNVNIFLILLEFSSFIFLNSIILVLPVIIILLSINAVMSILNRVSPQISIFSIGFAINLLIGIFVLSISIPIVFPFFQKLFYKVIIFVFNIILEHLYIK